MAEDIARAKGEDALGGRIEVGDAPGFVHDDDGVQRGADHRRLAQLAGFERSKEDRGLAFLPPEASDQAPAHKRCRRGHDQRQGDQGGRQPAQIRDLLGAGHQFAIMRLTGGGAHAFQLAR